MYSGFLPTLLRALYLSNGRDKVFMLGGNNVAGCLGHIGAMLELAGQIEAKEVPDVDFLYLPIGLSTLTKGSACTLTGLIIGYALARHLKLDAFKSLKIVGVPVSPEFAKLHANFNYFTSTFWNFFPLSPTFGIKHVCSFLASHGVANVSTTALEFLKTNVEFVTDPEIIGKYGSHSPSSLSAASLDTQISISGNGVDWIQDLRPWLCGHFAAKPFAVLLERLDSLPEKVHLFWQTKSAVQPLSTDNDEFEGLKQLVQDNEAFIGEWSKGKAYSKLRAGKVDVVKGKRDDYVKVMSVVE